MFCIKCGAKNSDEAIYCQKCGALLEAEQETRIARPVKIEKNPIAESQEIEKHIFSISPTLMFVKIGYGLAILGGLLLVAAMAVVYNVLQIPTWISILVALSLLLIPAFYHLKQKIVRYTLTDSKIEIDEGLISKTTRTVPLRTIQDITVSATVPQRMLGLGNLVIENAGESHSRIILKNINSPKKYADALLKQMRCISK